MQDLQREIINQVASGKISAEEGATRLESLETAEAPSQAPSPAGEAVSASLGAASTRRVKVASVIGSAEIVGDPTVTYATAEGPHKARQEGDTLIIEQGLLGEHDRFTFGRGDHRAAFNSIAASGQRKLRVRMNPDLPLTVQVNAGSLRVEGVHGSITGEVLAGNCKVSDFAAPLDFDIQAGNLSASGRLAGGASKVRCEMGNVTINLEKGSSVKVSARATMGKVSVDNGGGQPMYLGDSLKEVTVGSGEGSLDIDCTMGNVRVSA